MLRPTNMYLRATDDGSGGCGADDVLVVDHGDRATR